MCFIFDEHHRPLDVDKGPGLRINSGRGRSSLAAIGGMALAFCVAISASMLVKSCQDALRPVPPVVRTESDPVLRMFTPTIKPATGVAKPFIGGTIKPSHS